MRKTVLIILVVGLVFGLAALFHKNERGERVYESFFPSKVDSRPVSKVTTVVYHDDRATLVVYFSDRPRVDYENFPIEEYQALQQAEDQSAYYFKHIQGRYKPY